MEIIESFDQEVMSYNHNCIDEVEMTKLQSLRNVSATGNEYDVIWEPCIPGECVFLACARVLKMHISISMSRY